MPRDGHGRLDWRFACGLAAVLIVLFGAQQYFSQPLVRRNLTLGQAIELQAVTWGLWLLLLPAVFAAARSQPAGGRLTTGWWIRTGLVGVAFVSVHSVAASVTRWALGLSISSELDAVVINGFSAGFASNCLRYAAILAGFHAWAYHHAVRAREQRAARLEADLVGARLANVEAALRPHFLFNTLNSIVALIRDDPRQAERLVGELADLLRESLRAEPMRQIALADELAFTEKYLAIERVRFPDRLAVRLDATDEARRALVPHLILQPLVENAVRHGIAPLEQGGLVAVTAARENGRLRLRVVDDGVGVGTDASGGGSRTAAAGSGIGLRGVRARLTSLYGDDYRFDISRGPSSGTIATLEIPYQTAAS